MKLCSIAAALAILACGLRADPHDVGAVLEQIRAAHHVPALAAAAVDEGQIVALGVTGLRRAGCEEPVMRDDRWHLGSCTKSMTASVAAMLVEDGFLQWDITIGEVDQPWGHRGDDAPFHPVAPGRLADNPPAIGPAGTVHMSIADFARYAAWHVAGERGDGLLLSTDSFHTLHTPPAGQKYAMGWATMKRRWSGGTALMHNGQNTMFYSVMWLGPGENTCFVAACNADGYEAEAACDEAITKLINLF